MSSLINLRRQVQKVLRIVNGGTGNTKGWSQGVIKIGTNRTGSTIPLFTLVRLLGSYSDARITPTTATDETTVLGVVVGYYDTDDGDTYIEDDAPNVSQVAVLVQGTTRVLLGASATRGQYAYAHATDGTAYSSSSAGAGAFGTFQSSGTVGNTAVVILRGAVNLASSITYAAPGFTLGTANAAGAASTVVRSDATIALFDATLPAALGTAAVGAATKAARRDHVHPMPALDSLTDVAAASPIANDVLTFDGSNWTAVSPNDVALLWRPLMDGYGNVITDSGTGEAIMALGPQ